MYKILLFWLGLLLSPALWADESIGLEFPVQDAEQAISQNRFEFVGIEFADGVELTGLDADQIEVVKAQYSIRMLNKRWQSYSNIEDRPEELARMRGYALRYNIAMWRGMNAKKVENFKRYRY